MAQFALILKSVLEFLGLAKFFYKEFKTTDAEKKNKIDTQNQSEVDHEKKTGRPE